MIDDIPIQLFPDSGKNKSRKKAKKVLSRRAGENMAPKPTDGIVSKKDGTGGIQQASAGTPYPNIASSYSGKRIDVRLLEQTARAPPIARSLWQLQLIAFPSFEFKLIPPPGQEEDTDVVKDLVPKMKEIDRRINTTILCVQAMYDVMTYGSCICELTWKNDEDGYVVPDVINRLPASSFRQIPTGATGNRLRYVVGNILKGIVFDKENNNYEYWQLQNNYGSSGIPTQIPTEQVIHIKDLTSQFVDGEPYLQGIVSTITQLEFVRKRVMQTVSRIGSPKQIATVGVPPEYLKALETAGSSMSVTSAIPGASSNTADIMLTDLWAYATDLVANQSADLAVAVPKGIELSWDSGNVAFNPVEVDTYLIKEAISHIFPRDMLEITTQAISTSSAPLLQLLKMMVQGWQNMCSRAFQDELWTQFLEYNGFTGWRVELEWNDLIPQDEQQKQTLALQRFTNHVITLDEARESLGLSPLDEEERAVIMEELKLWKQPNQQQPGMPGMPGMPGGEGVPDQYGAPEGEQPAEEEMPDMSGMTQEMLDAALMGGEEEQKMNMTLDGFVTPSALDASIKDLLSGVEARVFAELKKTNYFKTSPPDEE